MNKQNLLSRAEMKKVMGGVDPEMLGDDCKKTDCGCAEAAVVKGCDSGTCDTSGSSASCYVNGAFTAMSCATACG